MTKILKPLEVAGYRHVAPELAASHEALRNLPDEFPVYQGFQGRRDKGIAWTTDREKAVWFANRFAVLDRFGEPKLLTGVTLKKDVLGYFTGRGESEVVIDPAKVKKQNVTILARK